MKRMLIDAAHTEETRVAIIEHGRIFDYDFITSSKKQLKGNIYLAKITRVEPSLQAAFVEYGGGKQGFLPFSEIHPDYYQLPQEDKLKLLEEQIAEAEAEEAAEDEAFEREQAAREARFRDGGADEDDTETDIMSDGEPTSSTSLEAEPASASTDITLTEVAELAVPQTFAAEDPATQPLESTSFVTTSDVVDALPEETSANTELTSSFAEEGSTEEQQSTTPSEEADEPRGRNRGRGFHRRYRIQEVIKRNQIVLVQVIKEERGNKGCSLTTYISLAGRSAVLMPNSPKGGGISRKITDRATRKRLKEVASEMRTHKGMSVIIRTAGLDRTKAEIRRDYEYLAKLWNQIREQTLSSVAPALIYEEGNLVKRSLRDLFTSDIEEIIIEGEEAHNDAKEFVRMLMPSNVGKVKLYKDTMPIFAFAGIEDQLMAMTEPQVKLPSGGYIVINPTEALISIDVNSGRSTTERNVEETALKTNVEAAAEIARQLRLRDLAGLIVIDFIDMNYGKNRKAVERAMKDALRQDRAKMQVGRISMFGLLELSRQRMRPSISESMGEVCPHCRGTGYIHSVETVGIQIIRTLEKEAATTQYATLRVTTHPEAALHLLNEKRAMLQSLEQRYSVSVIVLMDTAMITGNFRLIKITRDGKEILHEDARSQAQSSSMRGRRRGKRGGRERGDHRHVDFSDAVEASNDEPMEDDFEVREDDNEIIGATSETEPRSERSGDRDRNGRRGRRGGRGRDRQRFRGANDNQSTQGDEASQSPPHAAASEFPSDGTEAVREETDPRNRRRGRRGGRNRHRPRGERGDLADDRTRSNQENYPQAQSVSIIAERPHEALPSVAGVEKAAEPRSSFVIPIMESQTNPSAIASPIVSESQNNADKPKRRGWWSKMVE